MRILVAIYSEFLNWQIPPAQVDWLRHEFPDDVFDRADSDAEVLEKVPGVEVAFSSRIGPDHYAAAPGLRWIHSPAAGVGRMLFPAMIDGPVLLTNARGISAAAIAEHVVAVSLTFYRKLREVWHEQSQAHWAQSEISGSPALRSLRGARVLVVGLGAIGREVARLIDAFGATVVAIRRRPAEGGAPGVSGVLPPERLLDELGLADIVVLATPLTDATAHLIGAAELEAMRPGALLINVGRGRLVDETALAAVLETGHIQAALDVFEREPLPSSSPLWSAPGVLVTPHVAGTYAGFWPDTTALFADNLRRFRRGEPLVNLVDKRAGY